MYAHTPVSTEQLLAEYRTGTMSPTMLAEKYGWCPNTIYHRLRDAGLKISP